MLKALCLCAIVCLATGCSETLQPIDGPMASVTVYGVVSRPDGTPAPGVNVLIEARAHRALARTCEWIAIVSSRMRPGAIARLS